MLIPYVMVAVGRSDVQLTPFFRLRDVPTSTNGLSSSKRARAPFRYSAIPRARDARELAQVGQFRDLYSDSDSAMYRPCMSIEGLLEAVTLNETDQLRTAPD